VLAKIFLYDNWKTIKNFCQVISFIETWQFWSFEQQVAYPLLKPHENLAESTCKACKYCDLSALPTKCHQGPHMVWHEVGYFKLL
jgi:hypothetical protein